MAQQLLRQIAYIVRIKDILDGTYTKEEGWNPSHVKIGENNVSRVNLIGIVLGTVEKENMQEILVDVRQFLNPEIGPLNWTTIVYWP